LHRIAECDGRLRALRRLQLRVATLDFRRQLKNVEGQARHLKILKYKHRDTVTIAR
jgi:hypothetical protein